MCLEHPDITEYNTYGELRRGFDRRLIFCDGLVYEGEYNEYEEDEREYEDD